jgi:hypothetical protein
MLNATCGEGAVSLEALEHLARNCPDLQHLGLFPDASPKGAQDRQIACFNK